MGYGTPNAAGGVITMEQWIRECKFERLDTENDVTIEGGIDEFERVDIRQSDDSEIHVFKLAKRTPMFELEMRWDVLPENDDLDYEEIKSRAKTRLRTSGSYYASQYLDSMDLPPLQGLFIDAMTATFEAVEPDSDDSES